MVKVKLKVLAGEAKSGPPLAPILGQHQINLMEFCKLFNAKSTELYTAGIPTSLKLYKKQGAAVRYVYQPISFYSLVINFCLYFNKEKVIRFSQLYDIYIIRELNLEKLNSGRVNLSLYDKAIAKQLFGFLKSSSVLLQK